MCVRLWEDLPVGRAIRLTGASHEVVALALDPSPDTAPAVITWRPGPVLSQHSVVMSALDELETAAIALFPAWLPGAAGMDGSGGANVPAVRAAAAQAASSAPHFAPYLAHLAERALRNATADAVRPSPDGRFLPEVRARGVVRALASSFGRSAVALLVRTPDGLTDQAEEAFVGACEWLAHRGGVGVWLTGPPLKHVDRLSMVPVRLPDPVASIAREAAPASLPAKLPAVSYPPVAGQPHPASRAEHLLESALAQRPWADGRAWNQTYQSHFLVNPIRVDLVWWAERCVVEIDGPEHRAAVAFEADRRRDVRLQLDGYAVLRFTNSQVGHDLEAVVSQIQQLIRARRLGTSEGQRYARQQ
jgi:very-short-patch-repair endonuclease